MTETSPAAVRRRRRAGDRIGYRVRRRLFRVWRRTFAELAYLLTAPVTAAAGLVLAIGGLCVGTVCLLLPGGSRVADAVLVPARWAADVERWRIGKVRPPSPEAATTGQHRRPKGTIAVSGPEMWLDAAHAVVVFPVVLVTWLVTALWLGIGVIIPTDPIRDPIVYGRPYLSGPLKPMELSVGSAQSHIDLSVGITSQPARLAIGTVAGLLLIASLPLVTRVCVAVQAGLGQALLSDASALHRRISGLEQERDDARAQTVAAVTAEASSLRRLERDIHDGPQQRLVRLAMDLGRAQHNFDSRPESVRVALADAIAQAQEALEELRALSRGIAPPVLVDRGLYEALRGLAARSVVPAELDVSRLIAGGPWRRDRRVFRDRRGPDQRGQAQPRPPVHDRVAPCRGSAAGLGDR